MSEYWVSQAKHYCKYCKVWMADNKVSIRHHESGKRHKEALDIFFREKRDAKTQGAMSQAELNRQLREIDKAAREQAVADAAMFGLPMPPPPPPTRPSTAGSGAPPPPPHRNKVDYDSGYKKDDEEEEVNEGKEEEEETGRYKIGDITYLEGKHHEDKIVSGMSCEVWVEAEDRWIEEAQVLSVKITAVPNTTLVFRKFKVAYKLQPQDEEALIEEEVNPDRLRLKEEQLFEQQPAAAEPEVIDEHTGLGAWQTMTVRVVDEEAERAEGQRQMREEQLRRKQEDEKRRLRMMQEAMEGEDALSSYDPYNRGVYKGVDLTAGSSAEALAVEVDLGGDRDGPIAFKKKRKAEGGGGKFRRKARHTDDEEG